MKTKQALTWIFFPHLKPSTGRNPRGCSPSCPCPACRCPPPARPPPTSPRGCLPGASARGPRSSSKPGPGPARASPPSSGCYRGLQEGCRVRHVLHLAECNMAVDLEYIVFVEYKASNGMRNIPYCLSVICSRYEWKYSCDHRQKNRNALL